MHFSRRFGCDRLGRRRGRFRCCRLEGLQIAPTPRAPSGSVVCGWSAERECLAPDGLRHWQSSQRLRRRARLHARHRPTQLRARADWAARLGTPVERSTRLCRQIERNTRLRARLNRSTRLGARRSCGAHDFAVTVADFDSRATELERTAEVLRANAIYAPTYRNWHLTQDRARIRVVETEHALQCSSRGTLITCELEHAHHVVLAVRVRILRARHVVIMMRSEPCSKQCAALCDDACSVRLCGRTLAYLGSVSVTWNRRNERVSERCAHTRDVTSAQVSRWSIQIRRSSRHSHSHRRLSASGTRIVRRVGRPRVRVRVAPDTRGLVESLAFRGRPWLGFEHAWRASARQFSGLSRLRSRTCESTHRDSGTALGRSQEAML